MYGVWVSLSPYPIVTSDPSYLTILEPIVFHVSILIASWHFLHLANLWPGLMRHWAAVEKRLPRYGSYMERSHPVRRIRLVAFLLLSLSLSW